MEAKRRLNVAPLSEPPALKLRLATPAVLSHIVGMNTPKLICLLALFAGMTAVAKDRKDDVQPAPLPTQLIAAKTVFILKGPGATAHTVEGGYDLAFDAFYSEIKASGRYKIVDKADDADLVMKVSYNATEGSAQVYGTTNSVHSSPTFDLQLLLMVYDRQSKAELWSSSVAPGLALRKKNQEKEMIIAGRKLGRNLLQRLKR